MSDLDRAFQTARRDLADLGLLADGRYLDRIRCHRAAMPAIWGELGYVFDDGVGTVESWLGFEPGVIYVPINATPHQYAPGGTLLDTIRHEFAHAWAWLDRTFVDGRWFRDAFGAGYEVEWSERPEFDRAAFVSEYATTSPREDFAETFMTFVKYRNSVHRFEGRRRLAKKIRAVEAAVARAARERARRIRGPRGA